MFEGDIQKPQKGHFLPLCFEGELIHSHVIVDVLHGQDTQEEAAQSLISHVSTCFSFYMVISHILFLYVFVIFVVVCFSLGIQGWSENMVPEVWVIPHDFRQDMFNPRCWGNPVEFGALTQHDPSISQLSQLHLRQLRSGNLHLVGKWIPLFDPTWRI